jgi:GTP-binding protein HflX
MSRVREAAKITSGGERAGKGGMGEYVVDVKFRDLKRRMSFIKEKLDEASRKRELYHHQRLKTGMSLVSLVGYTSSGKTTLFNLLTGESKQTSSSLFTTLSTTTRVSKIDENNEVLLTDTVGFISRLPTYMIDAFKSTLEESLIADVILLLIDSSEEVQDIRIKYNSCRQVLRELGADESKIIVVFTKHDKLVLSEAIAQLSEDMGIQEPVSISSTNMYGINKLKIRIRQRLAASKGLSPPPVI